MKAVLCLCSFIALGGALAGAETPRYHLEAHDGRWDVVTPSGQRIFLLGLNHLGDAAPRGAERARYFEVAVQRLRDWGLSNLGYGTPPELRGAMPFIVEASFTTSGHWQATDTFRYADVFEASFQTRVREAVRKLCAETRDHPNLIGYYWSDTPRWDLALARRLRGDDWVSALRRLPADAPGKRAYVGFLRERYQNDPARFTAAYGHAIAAFDDLLLYDFREFDRANPAGQADDRAFLGLIAQELYRVTGGAFREFAPGRLIFGERYKLHDHPDEVLRAAAKWIDVLSIQPGPSVGPRPGAGTDETQFDGAEFDRLHRLTGKPILICDHRLGFRTPAHPVSLWHQFPSEREALAATARFALAAAEKPYLVGYQHCQYRDSFSPERGNMVKPGLIRADGTPYGEFTAGLARLNARLQATHETARSR